MGEPLRVPVRYVQYPFGADATGDYKITESVGNNFTIFRVERDGTTVEVVDQFQPKRDVVVAVHTPTHSVSNVTYLRANVGVCERFARDHNLPEWVGHVLEEMLLIWHP